MATILGIKAAQLANDYPAIVTSGLIIYLDAANTNSYPGTGTTWYDLSGNNNNATLVNSPTLSGQVFQFNGTNQYATVSSINLASSNYTVMGAARYSGATRGRIITSITNNWLIGHWSNTLDNYYAEGWASVVNPAGTTAWKVYAGTGNISLDQYSLYSGDQQLINNSAGGTVGPNGLSLGRWGQGGGSEYSTCEVGFVVAYNRVLSQTEITQNYNALKSRYGL
jgi:hypothetical protein